MLLILTSQRAVLFLWRHLGAATLTITGNTAAGRRMYTLKPLNKREVHLINTPPQQSVVSQSDRFFHVWIEVNVPLPEWGCEVQIVAGISDVHLAWACSIRLSWTFNLIRTTVGRFSNLPLITRLHLQALLLQVKPLKKIDAFTFSASLNAAVLFLGRTAQP